MDIEEPVYVVEYDENWPDAFLAERQKLSLVLEISEASIEHIGSTAVPGMVAKPIIDIMLGLSLIPPSNEFINRLNSIAYEYLGESGVPDRYYFRRRKDENHNLHIVSLDEAHWKPNLALRDYLRANVNERSRYSLAKREALFNGNNTLSTYSLTKASIVSDLLDKAKRWQREN